MSKQTTPPDWFWFYKLLLKRSHIAGRIVPELVVPSGDEVWTAPNGQKMKWRDCWHSILEQFAPFAQTRSVVRYNKKHPHGIISLKLMDSYQPNSGKDWLDTIDDAAMLPSQPTKADYQKVALLHEHQVEHYQLIKDVCGWALDCTLKYCRYRMGLGDWSIEKRGYYYDVPDTRFFTKPRSQVGCRALVKWFIRFANARRQFHLHIERKVKNPWHSQGKPNKTAREIITQHKGRPAKLKMGKTGNDDLWLILIWPITVQHHWTYKDVVRALRLHFDHDAWGRPAPKMTSQQAAKALKSFFERRRAEQPVKEYLPRAAARWRNEALRVSAADADNMRRHCKRLCKQVGLEKLNPRHSNAREPPLFSLVNGFSSTA